jgi:hypothetical protein
MLSVVGFAYFPGPWSASTWERLVRRDGITVEHDRRVEFAGRRSEVRGSSARMAPCSPVKRIPMAILKRAMAATDRGLASPPFSLAGFLTVAIIVVRGG